MRYLDAAIELRDPAHRALEIAARPSYTLSALRLSPCTVSRLQRTPFDVIVSDLGMPGTHGFSFLEQARKLSPTTGTIILKRP